MGPLDTDFAAETGYPQVPSPRTVPPRLVMQWRMVHTERAGWRRYL